MNASPDSKCSTKNVCITIYFLCQVLGFTACLLAVVSPSWQFVYLEEGRTEHHHGLWLDCKRDYSNEYGRPREFYEKLYRLDHLQGPFDQFSLPPLDCVYKFDYWIDEEDLYEHGYDENRLQDDAYQHLFLGWKIAALTALCFSLVCSLIALIISTCAFCHRLLVCVATVLSTMAVITGLIGNTIFFMYARYQDNNIIKSDEGIYEQYFGWSFYSSLIGNALLFFAAVVGCVATSIAMQLGKAKLVKIELEENDSNQLLSGASSDQPFKRSFSAVYKIDSAALRKWERECMKSFKKQNFKRANSMPNIKRGQMRGAQSLSYIHSSSDISKAVTDPAHFVSRPMQQRPSLSSSAANMHDHYTGLVPTGGSAFPASANDPAYPTQNRSNSDEVVYEYVEPNSISLSSSVKCDTLNNRLSGKTMLNVYDRVPSNSPSLSQPLAGGFEDDEYLRPKNASDNANPSSTFSAAPRESTRIESTVYGRNQTQKTTTSFTSSPGHRRMPSDDFSRSPLGKSVLITPIKRNVPKTTLPPELPAKPVFLKQYRSSDASSISSRSSAKENDQIFINTFNANGPEGKKRSLTSLNKIASEIPVNVFDHSDSSVPASPASSLNDYTIGNRPLPNQLLRNVLTQEAVNSVGVKETNLDWPHLPLTRTHSRAGSIASNDSLLGRLYVPSEMDRSVGSSTIVMPCSPNPPRLSEQSADDKCTGFGRPSTSGQTFV